MNALISTELLELGRPWGRPAVVGTPVVVDIVERLVDKPAADSIVVAVGDRVQGRQLVDNHSVPVAADRN